MKDYFDRISNHMQNDTITDAKRNYYQGVIDSYFELGFLAEYERGELSTQLIDFRMAVIRKDEEEIKQREKAILFKLKQEGVIDLCQ